MGLGDACRVGCVRDRSESLGTTGVGETEPVLEGVGDVEVEGSSDGSSAAGEGVTGGEVVSGCESTTMPGLGKGGLLDAVAKMSAPAMVATDSDPPTTQVVIRGGYI